MANQDTVVHLGENSPEQVAFKLMQEIAITEGRYFDSDARGEQHADRRWILDTYAQCLTAVKGYHQTKR